MLFSLGLRRMASVRTATRSNFEMLRSVRSFSFPSGGYNHPPPGPPPGFFQPRFYASPVYTVVGDDCVLSFKMIPPSFKILGNGSLVLESSKRGRILFEFARRSENGVVDRTKDKTLRFALSAEEIGFLLRQLPANDVQFARKPPKEDSSPVPSRQPCKVCRITPGEAGTVTFLIDYELDNVGGQKIPGEGQGPMSITIQLGEVEVVRRIMNESIPFLVGWKTMCDIQDENVRASLSTLTPHSRPAF